MANLRDLGRVVGRGALGALGGLGGDPGAVARTFASQDAAAKANLEAEASRLRASEETSRQERRDERLLKEERRFKSSERKAGEKAKRRAAGAKGAQDTARSVRVAQIGADSRRMAAAAKGDPKTFAAVIAPVLVKIRDGVPISADEQTAWDLYKTELKPTVDPFLAGILGGGGGLLDTGPSAPAAQSVPATPTPGYDPAILRGIYQ